MAKPENDAEREAAIARVLRPLGTGPLPLEQAKQAAKLLNLHWATVYRLRRRFLSDPVNSSMRPRERGPKRGKRQLGGRTEAIVDDVLNVWLPKQRQLAHPLSDLTLEIRRRCAESGARPPSRSTVARWWATHREAQALERVNADAPPGNFVVRNPLDVVQVDHTQADLLVVDDLLRRSLGRPWLSLAVDVATRCVVGFYVGMDRPGAATVALLLTRVVLPKAEWLEKLGVQAEWPMHGVPRVLHLDNAAEFKSRALLAGCAEYGIELMYRPVGRPHFGGHIERLNRTLMERVHGLPGSTGSSPKGRKARAPEKQAALTLHEFEQWLALEIAQRYHHSAHRGLLGATPASTWTSLSAAAPAPTLPPNPDAALRFLVRFLPIARRTIQADGLTLFYVRYWHPIFSAWREDRRLVTIRYHPEDLSRIFVSSTRKEFIEVRYADLRRPPISLWEQRAAVKALRDEGQRSISEVMMFRTIEQQRRLIADAKSMARKVKRHSPPAREHSTHGIFEQGASPSTASASAQQPDPIDYSKPVTAYDVEQW
ncbi:Mu transposase C-terminal domain-containing protein [Caballeronia sp. LZ029]|nr:Mu transposase C-terminal domain-containing protein [Caballeronia sp. LZ029]MDR5749131.1 Mu transposase C-terminal domain-containing protein [Caballeronia sp. LZ029]